MLYYCTLFDSNYLTRGLAMSESLMKYCNDFHLYIFAFDDFTYNIIKKFDYSNITVISLIEIEDKDLLSIKHTRTIAEYCWTCTPSVIKYVIDKFNVDHCTYIDSDLYFFSDPLVLFQEMGDKSVLITEHRYAKQMDRTQKSGKYCVQYITFKNNVEGLTVLNWWKNACNEWCFNRYEDGKFGDQKYLDDWTIRFSGVHELKHLGGGLAPWNIQEYIINNINGKLWGFYQGKSEKFEIVFYHFHYLRQMKNFYDLGWYKITKNALRNIYADYIKHLDNAYIDIKRINTSFQIQYVKFNLQNLKEQLKTLFKRVTTYNLINKIYIFKIKE